MSDGVYYDWPAEKYHSLLRISKSGLDKMARSPAHYAASLAAPSEPSKSMRIGTAVHALVLEGVAPTVRPEFSGKGSVAARAEWEEAHAGPLVLSEDEAAAALGAARALQDHPIAGPAFWRRDGAAEVSALWTCPDTGAACKSRFDWLLPAAIVDLKTASDASAAGFARSVATYRYHVQDAFYSQAAASLGLSIEHFLFVAVETEPPYAVGIYQLDDEAREVGRRLYLRDLRRFIECEARNEWPAYPAEVQTLRLPAWAMKGEDQ